AFGILAYEQNRTCGSPPADTVEAGVSGIAEALRFADVPDPDDRTVMLFGQPLQFVGDRADLVIVVEIDPARERKQRIDHHKPRLVLAHRERKPEDAIAVEGKRLVGRDHSLARGVDGFESRL